MSHEKYSHERVIALGDSVTFGVGDIGKNFVGPGWGARVAHELNAKRFLNLSNLGARVRHLSEEQLPAALAFRPTIAIISIGGNDLLRSTFDPVEMECHLERVVIGSNVKGSDYKSRIPGRQRQVREYYAKHWALVAVN